MRSGTPSDGAVDEGRGPRVSRAAGLALVAGTFFVLFNVAVKDVRTLQRAALWTEDPYDAFVSFGIFFVVGVLAVTTVRVLAAGAAVAAPVARVDGIVRSSRLTTWLVTLVSATSLLGVVVGGGNGDPIGVVLDLALLAQAGLGVAAFIAVRRAASGWVSPAPDARPDALDDVTELARARLPGGAGPAVARTAGSVTSAIRAHPVSAAGVVASLFGAFIGVGGLLEGDPPVLVVVIALVGAAGMLAFAVGCGRYLRLVALAPRAGAGLSTVAVACIASAAAVPLALAFRGALWWIVGTDDASAGVTDLATLLLVAAVAAFASTALVVALARRRLQSRGRARG